MIRIKSVELRNFMSYGDEMTVVDISKLGPTLIVGENIGDAEGSSNGAGKSSLATAIIWCLFGRTVNKDRPGDAIVNWFTGKDCYVKVETTDGYVITRSRKQKGTPELIIRKDGADISASTTDNAQKQLLRLFNLDFEIFSTCVFFGQLGKSFLELTDAKRRSILERIFNLHRINVWAEVAKEKIASCEKEQAGFSAQVAAAMARAERLRREIDENGNHESAYEGTRGRKVLEMEDRKRRLQEELGKIQIPDIEELRRQWDVVDKIGQKLTEYERQAVKWRAAAMSFERDEVKLKAEIEAWKSKAGTTCPSCKQGIKEGHVLELCKPLDAEVEPLVGRIHAAKQEQARITKLIEQTEAQLRELGPKQQISEAEAVAREAKRIEVQIAQIGKDIVAVKAELNPYGPIIARAKKELAAVDAELEELNNKVDTYNFVLKHLQYIHNVYNDKKKLKSFMLGDLVPFLNERVSYYLKAFGCDFDLKFTPTLQDVTSRWDYEFCSGGERKRIDLAVMFAFYDLYVAIYGLQCNLLVLDEVDGRLDSVGVQAFVDVIEKDFARKDDKSNRPDAVFVISHKDEMRDAFSSKIRIVKEGGFSKIAEA